MRKCNNCKVEKPLEEFPKDKSRSLGRAYRCKPCMVEVYNEKGNMRNLSSIWAL